MTRDWSYALLIAAQVCLLGAVLQGCGPAEKGRMAQVGDQSPQTPAVMTPEGVAVIYPTWLDMPLHRSQRQELLDYIRDVVPEPDPRIDPARRGVPAGVTVSVLDPGAYFGNYSHTGLMTGHVDGNTIYVAWRGVSNGAALGIPPVPGLPHELRHFLTGDPRAGH